MTIRLTRTAVLGPQRQGISDLIGLCGTTARLEIILALAESPKEVGVLAGELARDITHVSHQLKPLRDAGVLNAARHGSRVVYSLSRDAVEADTSNGVWTITIRAVDGSSIRFAVQP